MILGLLILFIFWYYAGNDDLDGGQVVGSIIGSFVFAVIFLGISYFEFTTLWPQILK